MISSTLEGIVSSGSHNFQKRRRAQLLDVRKKLVPAAGNNLLPLGVENHPREAGSHYFDPHDLLPVLI